MKIVMFTNTYLPHVGGVANSVKALEDGCRQRGHEVRVIAPEADGAEPSPDILRVPAIQHFNGSDFSVRLPIPTLIRDYVEDFQPDIIHSHHPFLLGDAALREAWKTGVPIIFSHHTLYEQYTHYVPLDSPGLKRAAIQMATEYCNLCDVVIAPSESVRDLLVKRGVKTAIKVAPTGINTVAFARGNGKRFRKSLGIPTNSLVVGHVGRLAKEKNLEFLSEAVAECLSQTTDAVFLAVGDGECREELLSILTRKVEPERIYMPGKLTGRKLADAYAAIDCFAFSSQSETQGMVLAEAMAAGAPVVALDGPGVRDILRDGENGKLLEAEATTSEFSQALVSILSNHALRKAMAACAKKAAADFDSHIWISHMLDIYSQAKEDVDADMERKKGDMFSAIKIELDLMSAKFSAAVAAIKETPETNAMLE